LRTIESGETGSLATMRFVADLTAEAACRALRDAGVVCAADEVEIVRREERWAVRLPRERIAWFPASQPGSKRLAVERRVLCLLAARCVFKVPRILFVSDEFEVRRMVPGRCEPWPLFDRCRGDSLLARRIGRSVGAMLAEQHAKIAEADVAGWLSRSVAWPEPGDWIRDRLPQVVDDRAFIRVMDQVIERYEAVPVEATDRALVHGDVGLHNLAIDPSDAVTGIFDYDSAAWADRHHDFRYLLFDVDREDMLESALEVYESETSRHIDRDRVRLYNAACAISFLASRVGVAPDDSPCGRTLAEDLRWVRWAVAKVA
jgi:aminoglycoside phosphotransferase (APT) family kinase protein